MSSHHIIRENQEASVLLSDFNFSDENILQKVFEWSPIIVTDESSFLNLTGSGYKVDGLICHPDFSETNRQNLLDQYPIDLIYISDKSETIRVGIRYLVRKKSFHIYLFSEIPLEYFFKISVDNRDISLVLFNHGIKYNLIKSGKYEKWFSADSTIILVNHLGTNPINVELPDGKSEIIESEKEINYKLKEEGLFIFSAEKEFIVGEKY